MATPSPTDAASSACQAQVCEMQVKRTFIHFDGMEDSPSFGNRRRTYSTPLPSEETTLAPQNTAGKEKKGVTLWADILDSPGASSQKWNVSDTSTCSPGTIMSSPATGVSASPQSLQWKVQSPLQFSPIPTFPSGTAISPNGSGPRNAPPCEVGTSAPQMRPHASPFEPNSPATCVSASPQNYTMKAQSPLPYVPTFPSAVSPSGTFASYQAWQQPARQHPQAGVAGFPTTSQVGAMQESSGDGKGVTNFNFILRKANGMELGLRVEPYGDVYFQALIVRDVLPDGAIAAWNKQVVGCEMGYKEVRVDDMIVGINGEVTCQQMLAEIQTKALLNLNVLRRKM